MTSKPLTELTDKELCDLTLKEEHRLHELRYKQALPHEMSASRVDDEPAFELKQQETALATLYSEQKRRGLR